jgi:lysine N6-hydroxylase
LTNDVKISLRTNSELTTATYNENHDTFDLELHQIEQDKRYRHQTEALILATGYTYQKPEFIEGIEDRIKWDDKNRYDVHRNYSIDKQGKDIYVQNVELHTHGLLSQFFHH